MRFVLHDELAPSDAGAAEASPSTAAKENESAAVVAAAFDADTDTQARCTAYRLETAALVDRFKALLDVGGTEALAAYVSLQNSGTC